MELGKYESLKINKTRYSIPHILNISLMNIKPETFIRALDEHEIYIGTNTACSSGDLSTSVMALYGDSKRAVTTIRISISSITTNDEVTKFIKAFKEEYEKLEKTNH